MATTRNRNIRTLAWILAIVMTVFSMPVFPLGIHLFDFSADASTYDGRDRLGVWWWYEADGTNTTTRDNYLNVCEQMGATEIYYYGYSCLTNPTSSNLSKLHTFVAAAMSHGMRVSVMIDDPALVTDAGSSKSIIQKLATGVKAYWAAYPNDWLYGIHYDCEPGNYTQDLLQNYVNNVLANSLTYLIPEGIYCEFDVNPTWNNGVNCTYTYGGTTYKGFYKILANTLANGRGCVSLMSYRTNADNIYKRAGEGTEDAVMQCVNAGCDVTMGMECTAGEGSSVSLPDAKVNTKAQVETIIDTLQSYIKSSHTANSKTYPPLPGDSGVTVHHARSFCQNMSGNFNTPESYTGGGATVSRESQSYTAPPQTTTTTKNTSGMTLTKQALYYKGNMNVAVTPGGKYTDSAMSTAVVNDYNQNGEIDLNSGEYYEIIVTGKNSVNGDYLYPVAFGLDEYWASEYDGGTSISTNSSTVKAHYGAGGTYSSVQFPSMTLGLYHDEAGGTFTVNSIEINVYRWTSGGGDTPTSPTSNSSASSTTTQQVTTTTQSGGGGGTVSGNLIKNGDFSNGLTDWSVTPSGIASVSNGQLVISGNPSKDLEVSASFTAEVGGGKTYTLRFDMENSTGVKVKVHNKEGDGGYTSYTAPGTYTFDTASTVLSTNSNYKTRFDVIVNAPKNTDISAILDNFVLVEGTSIPSGEEESSTVTTYTVSVTGGSADKTTAAAGDTVTITAGSPATGYQFKNWTGSGVTFSSASSTVTTFTMPASNVTVTANYEKISYTVSVTLGTASKTTANYGDTITLTADTPATGMQFDKWVVKSGSTAVTFASATSTQTTFSMPAGNVSVEATYKAKTYTVSVTGGTASPTTQMYNNTVTITANSPQTGYQFKNWTTSDGVTFANANNATTTFTMPAKNVTVTANFEKINYTVSVTGGTASKTTANIGDTITLTPSAAPSGKVFDKWTSTPTVTFTGNTFTMPASNVSITATYKNAAYTVTVNSGSASPAGGAMGDTITITANAPATGYVFDKWTTSDGVTFANANNATTTFTLPAKNVTVTANYKKATYTVSVTYGSANPASAQMGDTVTITAQNRSGFTFSKWTSSDVTFANANNATTTFTMPAKNVSVTATYTEVIVEPDAPATPTLVSATADGYNVIFKWNAVSGAAGYRVYRKTGSGAYETVKDITGGTTATFTDEALAKGTYTYTVQAYVNGTSDKIWGNYNATGKSATVTFGAPVLTSAVASASGITVTWQKVNGATGYRLYRKDGTNWVTVKTIADANTVSYLAKGLISGQTYTYTVQAYYDSTVTGLTQWSDYDETGVSATAEFGTPETEGQANGMKITINWEAVSGAEGYRIYRKTADTSWRTVATVDAPNTTYTDENPVANVYYTYTVQAYTTENGVKIYSTYDATGTTQRVVLGTPTLSEAEVTGEGVVVSWEAVTGATGYRLYRWNGTAWKTVKTVIGINTTSYTDRSVNAVAGAKYTVQAFRNADGVNVWSDHNEAGVTAQ